MLLWDSAGFSDLISSRLFGKTITYGQRVARKIDKCEPWSDHLEESAIENIHEAIRSKEYNVARFFIAFGSKEKAVIECIEILKLAIEFLAHGEEFTFDLFFCLE